MKHIILTMAAAAMCLTLSAQQTDDPIVMRIAGQEVTRSEFEYNFNKNNAEGVIDRKGLDEYVDLFINYKLKVQAALDAHLDTLTSYQQEFRSYRDQQVRPLLVSTEAEEAEVQAYYDRMLQQLEGKNLILPAHIFVRVPQQASPEQQEAAKHRIDSLFAAYQAGADFAELAKTGSEDVATGQRGGQIGWIGPHQLLKEVEDKAYSMQKGEVTEPFLSTVGWHIMRLDDTKPLEPYDTLRPRILQYLEARGLKEKIAGTIIDSLVSQSAGQKTAEQILDEESDRLAAQDEELKYLIQEYHDGLLLYEICQRTVWEPASQDTAALESYFKKHKKEYVFDKPHFAGALIQARNAALLKQVQKTLKKQDEDDWATTVKQTFNADSVQVRLERRVFKQGENAMVDSLAFDIQKGKVRRNAKYPAIGLVGRKLKKGPQRWTDVSAQVVSDYQSQQEKAFVEELRRRYTFEVYKDVLDTVNKH